ncbi:MAG: tetratricopeptide repeat protein [Synergistaceae bacterium]|nr:tetratricopeptide repeat protein [Synergistaceae bacterium]
MAPVVNAQPDKPQAAAEREEQAKITALNDAWQGVPELAENEEHEEAEPQASNDVLQVPELSENEELEEAEPQASPEIPTPDTLQAADTVDSQYTADNWQGSPESEHHTSILNEAWHNAAGLTINLNEPPQEMWTDIDSDDEPKDYVETSSLQGDAYIPIPKHGANFTQRLQATLRGRKERAERAREQEAEKAPAHPYFKKAVLLCASLVIAIGVVCFWLWYLRRGTPENLNLRAQNLYEQGKFDEAAELYQRAHERYPHILTFLTGLARSSEKAGHIQTAIAAWNEYTASLPKNDTEHIDSAREELERLIPGGDTHKETEPEPPAQTQEPEPPQQEVPAEKPKLPEVRPITFDEALQEANHAFNIGMYSRAIRNFHKAHAIRENDIRPYVGLAGAYRAKGMFFDAKRILDEARRKFGRNPTLEVERQYLKGE